MAKPDLVFVTNENEKKVIDLAARGGAPHCKSCGHLVSGPHDCPGLFKEESNGNDESPAAG